MRLRLILPGTGGRMYLLKHIALRSAVVKGTSGGYRISISGLSNSIHSSEDMAYG